MNIKKMAGLLMVVFVVGCKSTIHTEVKLSELLDAKSKVLTSSLDVEVAACSRYDDSRKESKSLIETKQTIPTIFDNAKYIECYNKKLKSYASFSLPIMLDKDNDNKLASDTMINLVSNSKELLSVAIPANIENKFQAHKKNSYGTKKIDLFVTIDVANDLGKKFDFSVISAFVDDKPYIFTQMTVKPNGVFRIRMSDVSVASARSSGMSQVLFHKYAE